MSEIGHWPNQDRDDQQGPEAVCTSVDGEEQNACAHRGAEEANCPSDIGAGTRLLHILTGAGIGSRFLLNS